MPTERQKINEILRDLPVNKRLFRINAGQGWQGKIVKHTGQILILKDPRPLHAAPTGWPDLCGWETIEITPEMVGQKIAVFVGEEIKITGRLSRAQGAFRDIITRMGGIFRVRN